MKLLTVPPKPTVADPLVIDERENLQHELTGSIDSALFWARRMRTVSLSTRKGAVRDCIAKARAASKRLREMAAPTQVRLAEWQITSAPWDLDVHEWADLRLALALKTQADACKALSVTDDRYRHALAVKERLEREAARRFSARFLPASA